MARTTGPWSIRRKGPGWTSAVPVGPGRSRSDLGGPGSARGLLPDRDVLAAVARVLLAGPAGPALGQAQPGNLRHQVQLGRPDVSKRPGAVLDPITDDGEVMRDQALV